MTDLSIIIPIYNTPTDALQRCFDSLCSLSDITWEAILVDDGSEAATGSFCKQYAEYDSRFRYFYKENGGVSSARNAGIEQAKGTYITFVDADDILLSEVIAPALLQYPLVIFDLHMGDHIWKVLDADCGEVSPWQLHLQLTVSKSLNSPCGKLFLKSVIQAQQLRFDTGFVTAEDWNFVWDYCSCIESAYYTASSCYRYFRDNATATTRVQKFPDVMVSNQMEAFCKKEDMLPVLYPEEDTGWALHIAAAMAAEGLFNLAADMYLLKILTPQRKKQLRGHMRFLTAGYGGFPKKAALKAWVVSHCWAALPLLAVLRKKYIQ